MIGDRETAALISKSGSIDWLCLPAFDSGACFAALLGNETHGYWRICPEGEFNASRSYQGSTMILETIFSTNSGRVKLIDLMVIEHDEPILMRLIEGLEGEVDMHMDYVVRFDYGSIVPWVQRTPERSILAIAGPDSLELQTTLPIHGEHLKTVSHFRIRAGEVHDCALIWRPSSTERDGRKFECQQELTRTREWWENWIRHCNYQGKHKGAVLRSLLTLKALIYEPTGGIVAAPTTSLPETIGGSRNWDYRFSWVRDSTFTLYALLSTGFVAEAKAWEHWLIRAVAGTPSQMHIMYGIRGERRLNEFILDWLPGYENSPPVRLGNGAYDQRQLDIFGELMDTLYLAGRSGLEHSNASWSLQKELLKFLESQWSKPDEGIWEVRGGRQHFVHSKVMAWVAFDRAIRMAEKFAMDGPLETWKRLRQQIHESVLRYGFNSEMNSFTQVYGSTNVDASLLMLPLVGFIEPSDPKMAGTVRRVEQELLQDGFVLRYRVEDTPDGLEGEEGAFLACSFWLVDNYVLLGELDKANALFEKLLELTNDVGLLAEEYDSKLQRQVGNFPQALSHIALINSAVNLSYVNSGPAEDRRLCRDWQEVGPDRIK